MLTCDVNLPIPPDKLHRTACGASDISATVHVRVVAWPDSIAFLSVPVMLIAGGGVCYFHVLTTIISCKMLKLYNNLL